MPSKIKERKGQMYLQMVHKAKKHGLSIACCEELYEDKLNYSPVNNNS